MTDDTPVPIPTREEAPEIYVAWEAGDHFLACLLMAIRRRGGSAKHAMG